MHRIPAAARGPWQATPVEGVFGRDLLASPEGTAKLIRLMPGARYPLHRHPGRTEYTYVLAGSPRLIVDGRTYDASAGDFVTFPAGAPHALENQGETEALLFVGAVYHRLGPDGEG
jgi:quercetin dioxygenase-like cupin family protein